MNDLYHIAYKLGNALLQQGRRLSTVESCTGGGVAYALTAIPGSSAWFERGWVTYSNLAKQELLGVPEALLNEQGAVSEAVVRAMAQGGLAQAKTDFCIAVTGIAGPTGNTADKPVGTVWLAWCSAEEVLTKCLRLHGDRENIRKQAILAALQESYRVWCSRSSL